METKKFNLKNQVEYLSNINIYDLSFFENTDYLQNISDKLNLSREILIDYREGIHHIQEELCTNSLHLNEPDRQRNITKFIEVDLLRYLIAFDEIKNKQYKVKVNKGYIVLNNKFCPVLVNADFELIYPSILYSYSTIFNLINQDYSEIYYNYTNPAKRRKFNYEDLYEKYDNIEIINA